MSVTAACGHILRENEGQFGLGHSVAVKSFTKSGERAVAYMNICDQCKRDYERDGRILNGPEEEQSYLNP